MWWLLFVLLLSIVVGYSYVTKHIPLYGPNCYLPNKLQVYQAKDAPIRVTQLNVYPIKGCKPITLEKCLVTNRGLRYGNNSRGFVGGFELFC
jgi:hypothetical protein